MPSALRGAICRIRPLGRSVGSSAPVLRPRWRLELEPARPSLPDRLVGWSGGGDPRAQVRLDFPSAESAMAWAARHGLAVDLCPAPSRRARPRPYADTLRAGNL
ncbi:MAG: ETC complex I subunit [Geminicoccaceae bacterium]|nr:ETC complex I subunit [Geminicoccaceae bacterium]MCX8100889.1 ETC complex I subunit [Geminicoccaceae bacterium]MDW8369883.1 NADH dehydrogenase ubiquinone Fe-S protein 4 [Geminicoccaceae bacterium]